MHLVRRAMKRKIHEKRKKEIETSLDCKAKQIICIYEINTPYIQFRQCSSE